MLGSESIADLDCFFRRFHDNDRAISIDGFFGYFAGGKERDLSFKFLRHVLCETF